LKDNNLCNYYNFEDGERIQPNSKDFGNRFAYLDDTEAIASLFRFKSESKSIVQLDLPQMHCSSCVWLLEHLYRLNEGVQSSRVNFMDKEITLEFDPGKTSIRKLVELLTTLGYEPHIRLDSLNSPNKSPHRMRIYRIALTGFCFGNIMMLAFPEYFHIAEQGDDSLKSTFSYLSLALSIPALVFGGGEFFASAWRGIQSRYLNIDIPLALSIILTFGRSLYEIETGVGNGYLDSMTGIIFFMLVGRYFQEITHHRILFDRDYTSFFPISVSIKLSDLSETTIPLTKLAIDDTIVARSNELIPADSVLQSAEANIDYSFVTGESQPVHIRKGELIYAGGRIIGASAECKVVKDVAQSYLTGLWNKENYQSNGVQTTWIDRLAKHFTLALLIISAVAFLYWLPTDTTRAFDALTTVLIVACPCALLLSATFTQGTMLRIFSNNGMYFKNAETIDKLTKANHFVLDKTGTLTRREASIQYCGEPLSSEELQSIRGIATQSNHPMSRLLADELIAHQTTLSVLNFQETPGQGVEGECGGIRVRIGNRRYCDERSIAALDNTAVHICIDSKYKGYFTFQFSLRENAPDTIQAIRQQGTVSLVSGDTKQDLQRMQQLLGKDAGIHFNQMPADKLKHIHELQAEGKNVAMIGDGLNDAGALLQSDCGIAISDNSNNFSPACDIILRADAFSKMPELMALARRSNLIIQLSFIISLLYNMIGIGLAIQGSMQPVIAAILMPLSTITIILFTTGSSRFFAYKLQLS
jgi:Cu+-exporting ATPase